MSFKNKYLLVYFSIYIIFTGCEVQETQYKTNISCEDFENNTVNDGLNYLNDVRQSLGMTLVTSDVLLDEAASNHANFLKANQNDEIHYGHDEIEGLNYYTGVSPKDRLLYVGYNGYAGEGIAYRDTHIGSINSLLTAIYHRFGLLSFSYDEIGISYVDNYTTRVYDRGNSYIQELCNQGYSDKPTTSYYDTICKEYKKIPAALYLDAISAIKSNNPIAVIFPYNYQKDFCPEFHGESPEPVPNLVKPTGNPISIQFNDFYITDVKLNYFKLYEYDLTEIKNVHLLTSLNDPNEYFDKYEYALFPVEILKSDTWYRASASFTLDNVLWTKEWEFKTTK